MKADPGEQSIEPAAQMVRSPDGTFLATTRRGDGDGLPLLVVNAIGANYAPWRRALVDVCRSRPVITWDQRGQYESGMPADGRLDAAAHVEDALAVLEHHGIDSFVVVSWSSGTRIALELAAHHPERARALALVCGGYGFDLERALSKLEPAALLPTVAGVAKRVPFLFETPYRALVARPELAGIIRQSGIVAAAADTDALVELARGVATCDLATLLATYEAVVGDPAPELLDGIDAPTLLVTGERDVLTPPAMMQEVLETLADATLEEYEKATHYLPLEYPGRLSDDLRRLFERV